MGPIVFVSLLSVLLSLKNCAGFLDPDELDGQTLIVLSFDAFQNRYFDLGITPNLKEFRDTGCSAPSMKPQFPTKTFVNHFSIATGCFAGTHGVIGNELYDSEQGEVKYSYELFHLNGLCVPIWVVNERNEKHSACMMWPGCDYPYQSTFPTYFQKLDEKMDWKERTQMVMNWIQHGNPRPNLVMWYMEQPDSDGHAYGPDSKEEKDMIARLDHFFGELQHEIKERRLADSVSIILLSDHGMITVPLTNVIHLEKFLTEGTYKLFGTSPVIQVIPNPAVKDKVWADLSAAAADEANHFDAYNSETLPEKWHVNNRRRSANEKSYLAVAHKDYAFADLLDLAKWFEKNRNVPIKSDSQYGVHGYDNDMEEMQAIFMAKGPLFKSGKVVEPFDNIDLYQFFCLILDITCPLSEGTDRTDTWNTILKDSLQLPPSGAA